MYCTAHPVLFRWSSRYECHGGACSNYGGDQRCITFWRGNMRVRDH